ncbi:pirin family protein [Corallococcus praedator]|uniref:Pirin family protein n=1 Tax=Corallococcus praedator TaxID=2316724 RepID=A0ABX9QH37_9BACT|nr:MULTISPECIES: pirin family protein [Corallococcus]RKH12425.1 pirin family protein [Corallococcus sp. CA047B]RKH30981.1 pirin family protein [Corallococcus sp. CA031C]RKI06997.1 pirin family protein [Corallococcus praedator]
MIYVRTSEARGHANHGWLDTHHTFSFSDYYDPDFMGFRSLRVINEDTVAPRRGFGKHPHRDMEILTYVVSGAVEHQDSMGTKAVIRPGEVQRMSAGTGVLHSEMNPLDEPLHLLQIWLLPERQGLPPGYEQKRFDNEERRGRFRVVASQDGRDGSLTVHQDVVLSATVLGEGEKVDYVLSPGRHAWLQVIRGEATLNGVTVKAGDGAAVSEETALALAAKAPTEALLFDMA